MSAEIPPNDVLEDELNEVVTFVSERYSMSRDAMADLVQYLQLKLSSTSERHHVPFEDMLVKLVWVARNPRE